MSSLQSAWDDITSPYVAYWFATGILAACVILGTLMWAWLGWNGRQHVNRATPEARNAGAQPEAERVL